MEKHAQHKDQVAAISQGNPHQAIKIAIHPKLAQMILREILGNHGFSLVSTLGTSPRTVAGPAVGIST